MLTQAWLVILGSVTLSATSETFVGRTRARSRLILKHRNDINGVSAPNIFGLSHSLELRGGSDQGGNGYNDNRGSSGYYDDRGRSGYGEDRGGSRGDSSNYGYQDDGRNNDYYDRGRAGDNYESDRYSQRDYYDDKSNYYDDRGSQGSSSPSARVAQSLSGMPSIIRHGNKRIGLILLGLGAMFTMMGITSFFNKNLLRLGNLFFVSGVPMTIGPGRTVGYFFQPKKSRATACLCLGIFLVFVGHPVLGMALEFFGFLNLFGNMFPVALAVLRQMPIVGTLLGKGGGGGGSRRKKRPEYDGQDRYYDERPDDAAEPYY